MPEGPGSKELLTAGRNCWRIARAQRISFLIDAECYFGALASALARAERRVMIMGWDFDSRTPLCPREGGPPLGTLLHDLVERKPGLEIYVMVWRNSFVYGSNPELPELYQPEWSEHPRIHFRTDDNHPVAACRHDKIVVVDGKIAFVGGMDITQGRWDDQRHLVENPYRIDHAGKPYSPIHDVQILVDGAAAECVYTLARDRWHEITGERLDAAAGDGDPWPPEAKCHCGNEDVGVARTRPAYNGHEEVREIERMNEDVLRAAERFLYIENQYFALPRVAEALAEALERRQGPEVVVVANGELQGVLEQYVMAENRDRQIAFLRHADRHNRFRAYFPVARAEPLCHVRVHSKVLAVDDRLLRIGSSNINARSLGFDSECDVALEPRTAAGHRAVTACWTRLLAEHLGAPPRRLSEEIRRRGSVIAAIEALNGGERRLLAFPVTEWDGGPLEAPGSCLLDPARPFDLESLLDTLKPSSS